MSRAEYELRLKKHGYTIKGDYALLDTPYGLWKQKICQDEYSFYLESVSMKRRVSA